MTAPPRPGRTRGDRLALVALLTILVVVPAAVLGYQFVLRPALADVRVVDIVARTAEAGGFTPDVVRLAVGERARLRFSVPDVTHGIAIGPGLGIDLGHIDPGQVREVAVSFDRPGRYTFYCNTWCGLNHWRMRGTIEVYDPARPDARPAAQGPDPVIESLTARKVDIDAPHEARVVPVAPPDPVRGAGVVARLGDRVPRDLAEPDGRRSYRPAEAWATLVAAGASEQEAWDAVAHLWLGAVDPARLEAAGQFFRKNCAACHGERGDGRGPVAATFPVAPAGGHPAMPEARKPAAFSDPRTMLGGSGEIYYAKLRRGGMGTRMPSFGPLLTPDETWGLVDYLWTFVFAAADPRRRGADGAHDVTGQREAPAKAALYRDLSRGGGSPW